MALMNKPFVIVYMLCIVCMIEQPCLQDPMAVSCSFYLLYTKDHYRPQTQGVQEEVELL